MTQIMEPDWVHTGLRAPLEHRPPEIVLRERKYKRLVESIRDAGIFDQGEIAQEMKRRLLRHD